MTVVNGTLPPVRRVAHLVKYCAPAFVFSPHLTVEVGPDLWRGPKSCHQGSEKWSAPLTPHRPPSANRGRSVHSLLWGALLMANGGEGMGMYWRWAPTHFERETRRPAREFSHGILALPIGGIAAQFCSQGVFLSPFRDFIIEMIIPGP